MTYDVWIDTELKSFRWSDLIKEDSVQHNDRHND